MGRIVTVTEAKAQLSRLLAAVEAGERVVIGRAGRPVAVLTPYREDPEPRVLGGWEGAVWMAEDFDAPLPDELLRHFEGDAS
jgi:prevent-host-death family protein